RRKWIAHAWSSRIRLEWRWDRSSNNRLKKQREENGNRFDIMSRTGRGPLGEERTCPHCRATILRSARICPICEHSLRYDSHGIHRDESVTVSAFRVEGTIRHPDADEPWEYSLVLSIRNERGEEITRQVIGVGALQLNEARTFTVAVAVSKGAPS